MQLRTVVPIFLALVSACALLCSCGSSEPGVIVQTSHDCDDTYCNVEVEIRNLGGDTFDIEYEFEAYKHSALDSTSLVGELAGRHTISGGQSTILAKQFPVLGKPNAVATSTTIQRRN
jgi:hypothetical protein